jgi:hypothetical protein
VTLAEAEELDVLEELELVVFVRTEESVAVRVRVSEDVAVIEAVSVKVERSLIEVIGHCDVVTDAEAEPVAAGVTVRVGVICALSVAVMLARPLCVSDTDGV